MSKLINKAVQSPKRAVKKLILRKGAKDKNNADDKEQAPPDLPFFDMDESARTSDMMTKFDYSFNFKLDDSARQPPYAIPGADDDDLYLSDEEDDDDNNSKKKPKSKKKLLADDTKKPNKAKVRRGSAGTLIGGSKAAAAAASLDDGSTNGGYNSDGAISNKKKEIRAKMRAKKSSKPERLLSEPNVPLSPAPSASSPASVGPSPGKLKRRKSKESMDGSDHSKRSLKPRSGKKKKNSSNSLDGSDHSKKSVASAYSKRSTKKKDKDKSLDGSDHSRKSTGSSLFKPKSSKKKPSSAASLDGSNHSRKSVKRSKKKKDSGLDGSDHSAHSTASTKSAKKSSKDKTLRGGKKGLPKKSNSASSLTGKKVTIRTKSQKSSLSDDLSAEMEAMLNDDDAFSGSSATATTPKSRDKEARFTTDTTAPLPPTSKQQKDGDFVRGKLMSRTSAAFLNLWQQVENTREKHSSGASVDSTELKKAEEEMDRRLAEIEKLELSLAEETKELQQAKEDLAYEKESLELRIEEETQKNEALREIIDNYEKQKKNGNSTANDDLRRQVDKLSEENDMLKAKLRTVERELDKSRALKGLTRDTANEILNSQTPKEQGVDALEQEVMQLKHEKMAMADSMLTEREETESKLKTKDETISFLMGELEKLKLSRGGGQGGGAPAEGEMSLNGDGKSGWLGSVFTRSPGGLNNRKKPDTPTAS